MSSKSIGNESVRQCRLYLESIGHIHDIVELTGRFRKWKDMYSEWFHDELDTDAGFDVESCDGRKIYLWQVTTTTPKTHGPFIEFKKRFPCYEVRQFVRVKGKKPSFIIKYNKTTKYKRIYIK